MANMKIPAGDAENEFYVNEQEDRSPMPTSDGGRRRATKVLKVESEEQREDDEDDKEEKEFNQGPNAKPAKKFRTKGFVVHKTDIIDEEPPLWNIYDKQLLRKYVPIKINGKLLYKRTNYYTLWCPSVEHEYYSAPVSTIWKTNIKHIVQFHQHKIKKVPKVEGAEKK